MSKRNITCSALVAVAVGIGTFIHFQDERLAEAPSSVVTEPSQSSTKATPVVPVGDFLYPEETATSPTEPEVIKEEADLPAEVITPPVTEEPSTGSQPVSKDQCRPGGCSGQLCTDQPDMVSTCEWREEYACYQRATCERQPSGECGWTETPELRQCLSGAV